ncbi:hypothetical protein [Phenylobacterium sp.]|uniref:hypothetical protein n=1 Tax=Phenylobacterium sp. TaxID=1871053 RepID=UPI0027172E9A|nr:hypothetical protein [Phenylobacterium sp.]MDO8799422.1 hypothetical protein [Phenylobacterium sp.]
MGFVIGAAVVAAVVWVFVWFKNQQNDQALDLALMSIHAEARMKLSPEDMSRLTQQLHELAAITHAQAATGVPAKQASRMGKQAAIQSIASAIEIERMFSSKAPEAV